MKENKTTIKEDNKLKGYIMVDPFMCTLNRGYVQLQEGTWNEMLGSVPKDDYGFHICKNILEIADMYWYVYGVDMKPGHIIYKRRVQNRIFEIEADGIIRDAEQEAIVKKIRLIREIPKIEWDTQEMRKAAVFHDADALNYISDPDKELKLFAVQKDGSAIRFIKHPDKDIKLAAVQKDGTAIEFIDNPDIDVQLAAVEQDGNAIEFIDNPDRDVQLVAVRKKGTAIEYIENPDKGIQMAAVEQDWNAIEFIDNPDIDVQLAAVHRCPEAIACIEFPCKEAQITAVTADKDVLRYINNPDQDVINAAYCKRKISHDAFFKLKEGDFVFLKFGNCFYESKVERPPFYNVDADEPGWEVETSNGFAGENSVFV